MAFGFMINRLKSLVLLLLGIVKRALCCLRRRRRASGVLIPLTAVGIVPNNVELEDRAGQDEQSWNTWDDGPVAIVMDRSQQNPIQQQIEQYRQQAIKHIPDSEDQPQPDFFEDMTPQITKQPKIIIKDQKNTAPTWNDPLSPRLTLSMEPVLYNSPDLGTWEDSPGWEDQTQEEWDSDTILKEKRRLERQRRLAEQQQKRQERDQHKMSRPVALGARLS